MISPSWYIKSPVGDNILNWRLGISESVKEQIPNPKENKVCPIGYLKYPIGEIIPSWVFSSVSLIMEMAVFLGMLIMLTYLYQSLSKHQEVGFTPVTKVPKLIVVFWDLVGAIQK